MKTGDVGFVKANFDSNGPAGAAEPSIEATAHQIAADRTGPSQIMMATNDIDTQGYWTTDDFEALLGLAAYRYLAQRVGDTAEAAWASEQYDSLLSATNATLEATIQRYGLDYLPCSILQPNTANRCVDPEDANWTSPLGNWAWEGYFFGAPEDGPGLSLIDATYRYGFDRLQGKLPPDTFGGFPDDYYSSAYNAADGTAGLAGEDYRDQGILSYQFMIGHSRADPTRGGRARPAPTRPPVGRPPPGVGAGLLAPCLGDGRSQPGAVGLAGGPALGRHPRRGSGHPGGVAAGGATHRGVQLPDHRRSPAEPPHHHDRPHGVPEPARPGAVGQILFQLPSFVANIASSSAGSIDEGTGTVALRPGADRVVVDLRKAP